MTRVHPADSLGAARPSHAAGRVARAFRAMPAKRWAIAAATGALYGELIALITFSSIVAHRKPGVWLGTLAVMSTRWTVLMTAVVCALALGFSLMNATARRGPIRPRRVVLTMVGAIAVGAAIDPLAVHLADMVHSALDVRTDMFTHGSPDWWNVLTRGWTLSLNQVFTLVSVSTLSSLFLIKTAAAADALVAMQLRLDQARRRALAEELRTAEAAIDPDFLFTTLAFIDERFDHDSSIVQPLLDAMIRYLRAALPSPDEAVGTLGQQATLVRAYLDVQSLRSGGRMAGEIALPEELRARLFAPSLIVPLVALACRGVGDAAGATRIAVRARSEAGRLTVDIEHDGAATPGDAGEPSLVPSMRARVVALYGSAATVSFAPRAPQGALASIIIPDSGTL